MAPRPLSHLLPKTLDVAEKPVNGLADVVAPPPDQNEKTDGNAKNLDAAVADAAGAAAVAPKPQLSIDEKMEKKSRDVVKVDDVVDGDTEAGDEEEPVIVARQEPILGQVAKDGIDQLHNNLAAEENGRE